MPILFEAIAVHVHGEGIHSNNFVGNSYGSVFAPSQCRFKIMITLRFAIAARFVLAAIPEFDD